MRQAILIAALILLTATTSHAFIADTTLYIDSHRYMDDLLVIGIEFETVEWEGFTARLGYEMPSTMTSDTGRGDPTVGIMPVKSIYTVAVEKRIARGWYVSYNHFSVHWHKLAQSYYGHDMPPHGWYGDTYWRLEHRW